MPRPGPEHPAASDDLVEHTAAAFHTLVRSWHYDLEGARSTRARGTGVVVLEAMIVPTKDAAWIARSGSSAVDLANTWWEDLPADWREEFLDIATHAAATVVRAVEADRSVLDLNQDDPFISEIASEVQRPWMEGLPRVIVDGNVHHEASAAARALAHAAIHVYAGRIAGVGGLGTVPSFPPPDFANPDEVVKVGWHGRDDEKTMSFCLCGRELDPDHVTALMGISPENAHRRGDLRVSRSTGRAYSPYPEGLWSISSDFSVSSTGTTVEEHLRWLLQRLQPHADSLRRLMTEIGLRAEFYGSYTQHQWASGWAISAETLRSMSSLGASLRLSVYVEVESDDEAALDHADEG